MQQVHQSESERLLISELLRPGEEILWIGRGISTAPTRPQKRNNLLQRLFRSSKAAAAPADSPTILYLLTGKRVICIDNARVQREWELMLGMVQKTEENPNGSGNIIFDYSTDAQGESAPEGLLNIPDVAQVFKMLNAAIDAAYLASPWT